MVAKTKHAIPDVPGGLGERGARLWREVLDGQKETEQDLSLLESACGLVDRIFECRARLKTEGLTSTGRFGQLICHPLVDVEARAMAELRQILKMLGLADKEPKWLAATEKRLHGNISKV
jgi:P27 family predicted phage terminase small subunit